MAHPQIARAEINGVPFTLYYDYDQLKDGKLGGLKDDEKIEWFRLRIRFIFLEPLGRLYQGKTAAYRELNSLALDDLPARSFVVPAFSILLNGVEALGSFLTSPGSENASTSMPLWRTICGHGMRKSQTLPIQPAALRKSSGSTFGTVSRTAFVSQVAA